MQLNHRITSLERWGMRLHADFQLTGLAALRQAGFNGVLVNGGSGFGPDMLLPELLMHSPVLPELATGTVAGTRREMDRRMGLMQDAGLSPWLCMWGVPGPDDSAGSVCMESNRFFERRSKYEMRAAMERDPEIFGHRNPKALNWRGSRPLCISHPRVQAFYEDLASRLPDEVAELGGVFFFPGDNEPECCDDHCPRCVATGLSGWQRMLAHVNRLYAALQAASPGLPFYFALWNHDGHDGPATIRTLLDGLAPGIGICMTLSDNVTQSRRHGQTHFNQPWINVAEAGTLFLDTAARCHAAGRPVMALGEFSQSEVWDPVCHNMPQAVKVLEWLNAANAVPGVDAMLDFWGHRSPWRSTVCHAALAAWLTDPEAQPGTLLRQAAHDHYELTEDALLDRALGLLAAFDRAVDAWTLVAWAQRFSFAIGRDAARGRLYQPLIPPFLRSLPGSWGYCLMTEKAKIDPALLVSLLEEDRERFLDVAEDFTDLALTAAQAGQAQAYLLLVEGRNIALAAELIVSIGRTVQAADAFAKGHTQTLRRVIEAEIQARERQLEISGELGVGAGVNPILVEEDIHVMRYYLASPDFPDVPDERFHLTATPYSV